MPTNAHKFSPIVNGKEFDFGPRYSDDALLFQVKTKTFNLQMPLFLLSIAVRIREEPKVNGARLKNTNNKNGKRTSASAVEKSGRELPDVIGTQSDG